jgi:hypothetical protein
MNHTTPVKLLLTVLAVCLALLVTIPLLAQSGGGPADAGGTGYDLAWSTVDGGGYTFSRGGAYTLGGTAGQPDAGTLTGGGYTLSGGFWAGAAARYTVYLPLLMRHASP